MKTIAEILQSIEPPARLVKDTESVRTFKCANPENENEPCEICGGVGLLTYDVPVTDNRFGKIYRCPNNPASADADRYKRLLKYANLDQFEGMNFDSFETAPQFSAYTRAHRENLSEAIKMAEMYARTISDRWLAIEGPYGSGKTHIAVSIARFHIFNGGQAIFTTAPDLLDMLRKTFAPNSEETYSESFDRMRNIGLLVIDDLGVESSTEWAKEKLFQLINYRYINRLPTIITTNIPLQRQEARISSRLMQKDIVQHIIMDVPDYRSLGFSMRQNTSISILDSYWEKRFDTFLADTGNLQSASELCKGFAENPTGWLYITGDYGTGKTHLAAAIANEIDQRNDDVIFTPVSHLLRTLRHSFSDKEGKSFGRWYDQLFSEVVLILDDMHFAGEKPWAQSSLFHVIEHRYNSKLPTVFTASVDINKEHPRFMTRVMDRRLCTVFALNSGNYIRRKRGG